MKIFSWATTAWNNLKSAPIGYRETTHRTVMTPEQSAAFDRAFAKFDEAFKEFDEAFKR